MHDVRKDSGKARLDGTRRVARAGRELPAGDFEDVAFDVLTRGEAYRELGVCCDGRATGDDGTRGIDDFDGVCARDGRRAVSDGSDGHELEH